ncbi:MAG: methylmalonyl Co-A mutase-associated GTPase MeaB, partial [Candidatus Sumerlaeia bacterium]|nr:methylmalonyl Co-A mutase-associated GTPase MeaB [Candidatus Sumerlaeia bacterium]
GDPAGAELVAGLYPRTGSARIVGFTGPPGVGKSTLIGALVKELRERERRVAVLSIDPSSPFTRGALLGDRIRLSEHFLDDDVFIRSMASRGALGGLAEAALQAALVMDAAGFDEVLLETVGVGQAEIDVVDHADTVVLVLMPGSGDSIQALKAGVMEIPDVIVVNKAEHPLTDTMVREVRTALSLGPGGDWKVPIVKTVAADGTGVSDLLDAIEAHRVHVEATGTPDGLSQALALVRPRGTVILKTTCGLPAVGLDATRIAVDEISLVGSRCGPIGQALDLLATGDLLVERLIEEVFTLGDISRAFARAEETFKVLIRPDL